MPQEVQNWFRHHTFVIWLCTIVFGGGGTFYQLVAMTHTLNKWEPKIEKIAEHQLLIEQLSAQNKQLSETQEKSTDRIIGKMEDLIVQIRSQNTTVTSAVQTLAIDVSVLKEKHAND